MCGIVGALAFGKMNKKSEDIRQRIMRYFTEELLIETETRGKDATGAAILFEGGNYVGIKRGDKASAFISKFGRNKNTYGGFLEVWRQYDKPVKVYLGHCRAGTGGEKEENVNNHPIKIGNLIGVHNGIIKNDDKIIENLGCKRDGKVDSESIFRLFEHFTNSGKEPFTLPMVQKIVDRLDGQFAVALFNADNPYQIPVFRDGRPVEFFLLKDYNLLFIVSEVDFWNAVHFRYERAVYDHGLDLPSFIDTPIEKEALADDSCLIFDLTKKVNENTKIKDLGEWSKMERNKKIWKDTVTTTGYGHGAANYTRNSINKNTNVAMSKDDGEKKTRVFDNINKKYIAKIGDKVLKGDEEVIIPVDKPDEISNNAGVPSDIKSTDDAAEETGTQSLGINDSTNYGGGGKEENKRLASITRNGGKKKDEEEIKKETDGEDRKNEGKKNGKEDGKEDGKVIEVDMTQDPKELVESAENTFKSLSSDQKGYANIDDLIDKLDIINGKVAVEIGVIPLANRSFRYGWKKGFIKACKSTLKDYVKNVDKSIRDDEKATKREKHITGLKSLVILLAMHFDQTKAANKKTKMKVLSTIAKGYFANSKNKNKVNIENLLNVFGRGEKSKIKAATKLIEDQIRLTNTKKQNSK